MATFFAGTKGNDWTARIGAYMAEDEATASNYAGRNGRVFRVEVDWDADFSCKELPRLPRHRINNNDWYGDSAAERAEFAANEWDMVTYEDMDESGVTHQAWRFITDAACAAVLSVSEVA